MKAGEAAVIVGVSGGIGQALARELLRKGLRVWGLDINAKELESLNVELSKQGLDFKYSVVDITETDQLEKTAEDIRQEFGSIEYWVNGAGIANNESFEVMAPEVFRRIMDVNLNSAIEATRIALKIMTEQSRGQIVNIASVAGHVPAPFMTAYTASKFGLVGFTRSLQYELALCDSAVIAQLVSPGFVHTNMISLGEKMGFPEWLSFMLAEPESVAKDIVKAMKSKKLELTPTLNGKIMKGMHKVFPKLTVKSSKLLLTRGVKDLFLNRYHIDS